MPLNFEGVAFVTVPYLNVSWQIHWEMLEKSLKKLEMSWSAKKAIKF